jgi:hypothetical protein
MPFGAVTPAISDISLNNSLLCCHGTGDFLPFNCILKKRSVDIVWLESPSHASATEVSRRLRVKKIGCCAIFGRFLPPEGTAKLPCSPLNIRV